MLSLVFEDETYETDDAHDLSVDALVMSATWRSAGLELLRGVRAGWTRVDLARWLLGPYQEATSHLPRESEERTRRGAPSCVDERKLELILSSTRREVVAWLEAARHGGGPEFVKKAIRERGIVPTPDGLWLPLDKPRMLLKDRVLALFAADFLLRPQDYVGDLVVCAKCDDVVFDPAARQTGCCGAHRISGFLEVLRRPSEPPLRRAG